MSSCTVTQIEFDRESGRGFPGLFQTIFGNNSARSYAFGIGIFGITKERMDMAHLTYSFFDEEFVFIIREDSLVPVGGGTFFGSLFTRIATPTAWVIMVAIIAVYVVLITVGQRTGQRQPMQVAAFPGILAGEGWSTYLFNTAFKLFATATGQGKTLVSFPFRPFVTFL